MIKKKILSCVAAAIAAVSCLSVSASAAAVTFGPSTLYAGGSAHKSAAVEKTDPYSAVVNVTSGLTGSFYVTFRVREYGTDDPATGAKYIWVNGSHTLSYLSGKGEEGEFYYLKYELPVQSGGPNSVTVSGRWEP